MNTHKPTGSETPETTGRDQTSARARLLFTLRHATDLFQGPYCHSIPAALKDVTDALQDVDDLDGDTLSWVKQLRHTAAQKEQFYAKAAQACEEFLDWPAPCLAEQRVGCGETGVRAA